MMMRRQKVTSKSGQKRREDLLNGICPVCKKAPLERGYTLCRADRLRQNEFVRERAAERRNAKFIGARKTRGIQSCSICGSPGHKRTTCKLVARSDGP